LAGPNRRPETGCELAYGIDIAAYMLSCPDREQVRARTLHSLSESDWHQQPVVVIDETGFERRQERQEQTSLRLLRRAAADAPAFVLFLEDDLAFNRHLRHNLERWHPLASVGAADSFFGSLYDPSVAARWHDRGNAYFAASPEAVYGSQAFLLSLSTVHYVVSHWREVPGMQDIKMSRLAARTCPVYYHAPSLVQHVGRESAWGGTFHWARSFDASWRNPGVAPARRARPPAPERQEGPAVRGGRSSRRARRRGRVLLTAGVGPYEPLLALALPSFAEYAERHGYELVCGDGSEAGDRPAAWAKVPLLRRALARAELALWIDADAVVVDMADDIAGMLRPRAFQALVKHRTGQGRCPNTGVWLLRSGATSAAFLDSVWASTSYIEHPWWENAAACAALGYEVGPPCRPVRDSRYEAATTWLSTEWNSIAAAPADRPRIVHQAGLPLEQRLEAMRQLLSAAASARADRYAQRREEVETLVRPMLDRVHAIDGWLDDDEAELLLRTAARALLEGPPGGALVEVGSYCGRTTVVLGTAVAALAPGARVHAIDPHEGEVSMLGGGVGRLTPTLEAFRLNISRAGLAHVVETIPSRSFETPWRRPISLLLVDALHDYASVSRDLRHFAPWLGAGALVAFHDYAWHFPGVRAFVDELLGGGGYRRTDLVRSLVVLERVPGG
jgi:Methyltransferase domain/galactosyl transferase GMA12/MNN10 family